MTLIRIEISLYNHTALEKNYFKNLISNYEDYFKWSEEYIGLTMMCFFIYLIVYVMCT